jgi:hypothetical protein
MTEQLRNITVKLVSDDKTPRNVQALKSSWFPQLGFCLDDSVVVGNCAKNMKKDPSLGHLWHDVLPDRGYYDVELGAELPWYLPNFRKQSEYVLDVEGTDHFVCNRMVKAYVGQGLPHDQELKYYLIHLLGVQSLIDQYPEKGGFHIVPLRSFVSRRFRIKGKTAEAVIDNNFFAWLEQLCMGIYRIQKGFKIVNPEWNRRVLPLPTLSMCRGVWVLIKGKNDKFGCQVFASDIGLAAFQTTSNVSGNATRKLKQILRGSTTVEPYEDAIELARTFVTYGLFELAIIHICVACESLLSRVVARRLKRKNVSKTTLKEHYDLVTFSQLLHFHLPSLFKISTLKSHKTIIGDVNWARKRRNEIVHQGQSQHKLTGKRVTEVFQSAEALICFLKQHTGKERA